MDLLHLWCIIGVILQRTVNGQQLVSQGKPITSSSQHKSWSADKAVDGNKTPKPELCDCCAVTNSDQEPWFVLDLEQTYMVQRINVIGRYGYQSLRQMEIKLGTSQEGGTVLTKNTANVDMYDYILPSPQFGRYITLTLRGISEYFVICELEVYAVCDSNTYGVDCKVTCGNCFNNVVCDRFNGYCPAGCSAGVKGELCKTPCGNGSYGRDCLMSCGNCLGGETCNAETGICGNGCTEGFNGTFCNISCPAETFGRNCVSRCGNCFQGVACRNTNGQCEDGCEPGYREPTCKIECEDGTYGKGCTSICGNCHGDEICNKQNGTCQACECGYAGHDCKGEINSAASRGECPTCNIAMIVGGTLVSILAIEGVAAVLFLLIRKRRRSLMNDTINRSNLYELPNRGINEGEHEYESAMELDVNTNDYENTGHQAT